MNLEKIMNLQYRKVLTKKEEIRGYVVTANRHKSELLYLTDIEILSMFIIDLDNLNKPIMDDEISNPIKENVQRLLENNCYEKKEVTIKDMYGIYKLSTEYRISDELNKKIVINYAKYLNTKVEENFLFIGVDMLESIL